VSAGVLSVLAFIALSSDTFQSQRRESPQGAAQLPPAAPYSEDPVQQMMVALAWTPPSGIFNPDEIAAWFQEAWERLTPLERARLRPRISRPSGQPFNVSLPDTNPQEKSEALLTAIADAMALGLDLRITDPAEN
jgi:hypothetical protein